LPSGEIDAAETDSSGEKLVDRMGLLDRRDSSRTLRPMTINAIRQPASAAIFQLLHPPRLDFASGATGGAGNGL
jgi:hypothetical protein